MKILQIITLSELGGAQSVVINLSNALVADNDVTVVSSGDGDMWNMLDERVTQIKISTLKREISPLNDIKTILTLRKLNRELKPDVIHLHSSKIGILGRIAFNPSKIVYTVHGFDSIRVAYRKFLPIEKLLKYRTKSIIAVSKYDKKKMFEEGIINGVKTIYNGILESFVSENLTFNLNNSRKIILAIARISSQKRFDLFIDIAKLLPQYNFVWIGNKTTPENLPENVLCMGEVPAAGRYYSICDLCILPSNYEGLPMTIIEAMSYSKPVVASNVGGISEIIIDDVNGYALENNAKLFAEKISYILENDDIYSNFSRNSYDCFKDSLTVDKMVTQYLNTYKTL